MSLLSLLPILVFLTISTNATALRSRASSPISQVSASEWHALNKTVGGRLYVGRPYAYPCYARYSGPGTQELEVPDATLCASRTNDDSKGPLIGEVFGGYENAEWGFCMAQGEGCPVTALSTLSVCYQGSVPDYYIDVQQVSDIQAGMSFAKDKGIPLVVKNTGHDFKGRSSAPDSLALWTRNLQPAMVLDKDYTPESCSESVGPTLTYGAGTIFKDLFAFAHEHGYMAVGGTAPSVGASGGWITGGGHSALSPVHGLGVDNAMQMKVVLPNGTFVTANRCQNQDIFFAIRGGGGNAFGVVTETTSRVYPEVPIQVASISFSSPIGGKEILDIVVDNVVDWMDHGWGGYMAYTSGLLSFLDAINPVLTLEEAKESLKPLTDYASSLSNLSIAVDINITTVPNYQAYFNSDFAQFLGNFGDGISNAEASRLIPRENFATAKSRAELSQTLSESPLYGILLVAPTAYKVPKSDQPGGPGYASVTPVWRDAILHVIMQTDWLPSNPLSNTAASLASKFKKLSQSVQPLRDITPNGGAYQNEADTFEPDYTTAFWGEANYERLLAMKKEMDPDNLLTCHQCVGYDASDARYSCYPKI